MREAGVDIASGVVAGLRALLDGLIDYAGLFPPARLSLAAALANYAHYRTTPERWMLGRFILPAGQLAALDDRLMQPFTADAPLSLSLLCQTWPDDLAAMQEAQARWGARLCVEVLETRLPPTATPADYLAAVGATLQVAGFADRPAFFELPFDADWDARLEAAIAALAAYREASGVAVGFKLRCGGLTPESVPTPPQVARALLACRDQGVPLKATAGLHHPLRHLDPDLGVLTHGFVNLFGGGALAHGSGLNLATLTVTLTEMAPASFVFSDEGLRWGSWLADTAGIQATRQAFLPAFGSCSFDEPCDDLRALGWLPL